MNNQLNTIQGKVVLVTGGSRGIGKAIVQLLAHAGATVVFTYSNSAGAAMDLAASFQAQNLQVHAFQADIRDKDVAEGLVETIETRFGPLFAVINNAGITADKSAVTMSSESWEDVIATNLSGTFYLTQAALRKMIHHREGKVIMMSSVSGLQASPGQANYSATKAALVGLTRTLSHEMARFHIQVNAIAPGFVDTEMVQNMDEAARKRIKNLVPARRMGTVEEIANCALFLLSSGADYITGHTLVVDGGMSV
ncbi:SDR family NAD(P)-dependent oxidoreductase [Photobacterium sp. 1_MG-2023]|uniref:SDR family oxidoreductase n=1 Tax=Photobacterium sp. 1_MG-2023 TaxID=3062646 RepID=UPI0026E338BB|nr:SDR family NAD(P)-dependent oxidoreductase [Photobacterium sp. 1_MG-2023]MDO6708148.1 SDR family NAD(P)-dependent oxidoreductase [Photobacterium sp. 1_MG-2023]